MQGIVRSLSNVTWFEVDGQKARQILTGGSPMTNSRVTQKFREEKLRSNNSSNGNTLLLWGILSNVDE
jgi:hypothetical protein